MYHSSLYTKTFKSLIMFPFLYSLPGIFLSDKFLWTSTTAIGVLGIVLSILTYKSKSYTLIIVIAITTIGIQILLGYASFRKAEKDQIKLEKKTAEIDSLNLAILDNIKRASIEQRLTRSSLEERNESNNILNEIDAFELQEISYLLTAYHENDSEDIEANIFSPLYSRGKNWKISMYINTLEGPLELVYDKNKPIDSCLRVKRFHYLNDPFSSKPAIGVNFWCNEDEKMGGGMRLNYSLFNTVDSSNLHLAAKHAYNRFLKRAYHVCIVISGRNLTEDNADTIGEEFESSLSLTPLFFLNKEKNQFVYFDAEISSEYDEGELRIFFDLQGKPQINFNGEFYEDPLGCGEDQ